jgi:hypothetical protein
MENIKAELKRLKSRNEVLEAIVFKGASNVEELKDYITSIQKEYDEYYENVSVIEKLEWELLSPKERAEKEELMRLLKLKSVGKLDI